jgi:hypothetical protein
VKPIIEKGFDAAKNTRHACSTLPRITGIPYVIWIGYGALALFEEIPKYRK